MDSGRILQVAAELYEQALELGEQLLAATNSQTTKVGAKISDHWVDASNTDEAASRSMGKPIFASRMLALAQVLFGILLIRVLLLLVFRRLGNKTVRSSRATPRGK